MIYFLLVCLLLPRLFVDAFDAVLEDLPVLRPPFRLTGSGVDLVLERDDFRGGLPV